MATTVTLVGLAPPAAAATTTSLLLPATTAFSMLGRSCGGIQEQVLATGFDPTSGYPVGDVYLQTRCGGSGRGGGYHTTTYSAWAAVTWDLTGAVTSSAKLTTPPTGIDPAFSATDGSGNTLANSLHATNVLPANCTVGNTTYCTYRASLTLATGFVVPPRVETVSSTSGPAAGGTSVTITGTGFTDVTSVSFGGVAAASFAVISDTSISSVSPPSVAGAVDVTVASPGGTSTTIPGDRFTFVAQPSVTSLSPAAGPISGGTTVTIAGADLTGATAITFGGTPAGFTVNDDSSITAISPGTDAADTVDVTVTTPGGTSATVPADRFTYGGDVTLKRATPAVGSAGGGTRVTITGKNLVGTTEVTFGGIAAVSFTVNAAGTAVTATSPPENGTGVQTVDISVTDDAGTATLTAAFTYVAPVLTKITPTAGTAAGGTKVTISGKYLLGATNVTFGGTPAIIKKVTATSIIVIAPPGAGTVDVTVTTPAGTSPVIAVDQFTY